MLIFQSLFYMRSRLTKCGNCVVAKPNQYKGGFRQSRSEPTESWSGKGVPGTLCPWSYLFVHAALVPCWDGAPSYTPDRHNSFLSYSNVMLLWRVWFFIHKDWQSTSLRYRVELIFILPYSALEIRFWLWTPSLDSQIAPWPGGISCVARISLSASLFLSQWKMMIMMMLLMKFMLFTLFMLSSKLCEKRVLQI